MSDPSTARKKVSLSPILKEFNFDTAAQNELNPVENNSFSTFELERFLNNTLSQSQIFLNEEAMLENLEPTESNMLTAIALATTRMLKANEQLRSDLDSLRNSFETSQIKTQQEKRQYHKSTVDVLGNFQSSIQSSVLKTLEETQDKTNLIIDKALDDNSAIKDELDELQINMDVSNKTNESLKRRILILEKELNDLQQYVRRPTIEISGVDRKIHQRDLENHVIRHILRPIGVFVSNYEIVACHRLKNRNPEKPAPVVVRFVNRKIAEYSIRNRYKLKNFNHLRGVFITDNLCPNYRNIFDKLSQLKEEGVVKQVWSYNGKVTYKNTNNRWGRGTRVSHLDELKPLLIYAEELKVLRESIRETANRSFIADNPPETPSIEVTAPEIAAPNAPTLEEFDHSIDFNNPPATADIEEDVEPVEEPLLVHRDNTPIILSAAGVEPVEQTTRNGLVHPPAMAFAEAALADAPSTEAAASETATLAPEVSEVVIIPVQTETEFNPYMSDDVIIEPEDISINITEPAALSTVVVAEPAEATVLTVAHTVAPTPAPAPIPVELEPEEINDTVSLDELVEETVKATLETVLSTLSIVSTEVDMPLIDPSALVHPAGESFLDKSGDFPTDEEIMAMKATYASFCSLYKN